MPRQSAKDKLRAAADQQALPGPREARLLARCEDTWVRRNSSVELFLLWASYKNYALPVHPSTVLEFNAHLVCVEHSGADTCRGHVWKWLRTIPFPEVDLLKQDMDGWSALRFKAELGERIVGRDSGAFADCCKDVEFDCKAQVVKNDPQKARPPRTATVASEWASLTDRQKAILPWVGAAGLRQDSFCRIAQGDVARSATNTLISVEADKLHNQEGRVIKFGCTCHNCPVLGEAGIKAEDWCVLHGTSRNLKFPVSSSELDLLNKKLNTTGHGWRRALALGLRRAVEQELWCPPLRPLLRRFGWEDKRRPASYAVDLAKQQPFNPVRFDKGLRETTGDATGAPSEWKWFDVAEQTGTAKTTVNTGPKSYKVFERPRWEGGTTSLFGTHVVKAKSTTYPTGWDRNGGSTSASAPIGPAFSEDRENAAPGATPLDEAMLLEDDDAMLLEQDGFLDDVDGGGGEETLLPPAKRQTLPRGPAASAAGPRRSGANTHLMAPAASTPAPPTAAGAPAQRAAPPRAVQAGQAMRIVDGAFIGPLQPATGVPTIRVRPPNTRRRSPLRVFLQNKVGLRRPAWKLSVKQRNNIGAGKTAVWEVEALCTSCAIDQTAATKRQGRDRVRKCGIRIAGYCTPGAAECQLRLKEGRHDSGELSVWPTGGQAWRNDVIDENFEKAEKKEK